MTTTFLSIRLASDQIVAGLERVRALLESPERWCQNQAARTRDGQPTPLTNSDAYALCLHSAVIRASQGEQVLLGRIQRALEAHAPQHDFISWQDEPGRKHADVLRLIDRALAHRRRTVAAAFARGEVVA